MFILGKGCSKYVADESSLKIKEISYIHTESYSASSLKHGPFALLDDNFPVIIINCDDEYCDNIMSCYQEVNARNSPLILISKTNNINEKTIVVPENKHYGALLGLIPLQLISYYISINKNINPDTPKNLAKVVTVE
jgi:glucosamine--fructose-6-phosphate aminotransferase (isomerizing)